MDRAQLIMLPGPTNVPPRVTRAMAKPMINHRGPEFRELYSGILENAKYAFETENEIVILTSSGTGGVECSVSNVVSKGDKVLIPVNGIFSERLRKIVETFGGEAIEIPIEWGKAATTEIVEEYIEREKDVKAVALVYNETSTGTTVRCLKEIGELCRQQDIMFIVDAISILGGDYLPVDEWNVDLCVAGSQKCLMAPPGLTLVSVSEKAWSNMNRNRYAHYFDLEAYRKYREEGQTPYTPAITLLYGLDEALRMIKEEGLEARYRRHAVCARAMYDAVERLNLKPFADSKFRSNTVIAVSTPQDISSGKLREIMRNKYNVVVAGGMGKLKDAMIRIGAMGAVNQAEILQTVGALELALSNVAHKFQMGSGLQAARQVFE